MFVLGFQILFSDQCFGVSISDFFLLDKCVVPLIMCPVDKLSFVTTRIGWLGM